MTRFSSRPAEAWIEITPVTESGELDETVYRYGDLDFYPATPVPRLACEAPQFPHDTCKKAEIKVWFKIEPTRSETTVVRTVQELINHPEAIGGVRLSAELSREPDAQGRLALRIREHRVDPDGGKMQGLVKIEIDPQLEVEHEYGARRHTFYFDPDKTIDNYKLRLTDVEKFKKEAIFCTLPQADVGR